MVNNSRFNSALQELNDVIPVIRKKANNLNANDPDKNSWKAALNFLEEHLTIIEKHSNTNSSLNYVNRVNTFVKSRKNLNRGNNNNTKKNKANNNKANNNRANNNKANNNVKANNNKANNNVKANNNKANNNTKKNNKANNKANNKLNNNTKKNNANNTVKVNQPAVNEVKVNEVKVNEPKAKDDKKILKINEHEASSFNIVPKNTHFM